jgi:hypothetical protein
MDVREVNSPGNRAIRQSERCTKEQLELIQLLVEQAYRDGELVLSGLFEESPWFRF